MSRLDSRDLLKIREYQAKALEALERAAHAKDADAAAGWKHVAESYYDLAERLDRKSLARRPDQER